MAMGSLNYASSNADEEFELCEDSESDDKEGRPSSSQKIKLPVPGESLQKAKTNPLVTFVVHFCVFSGII